ncbi:MAG: NAD-dependent epimerase [Burkholderiales bacterium]
MKVLVTGCAGFIGMHCAERLLARGDEVIGVDNLSPYYPVELKRDRLRRLEEKKGFRFSKLDLADAGALGKLFAKQEPQAVLHLAAQPGVRYSLENPGSYVQANLVGFANLLEAARAHPPRHLVYASSSSVYGGNARLPWSESDNVDHPVSLYAATKKSNELMAHVYSHLFGLPTTGLRFFTVYGPWGRPDMSPVLFARAIMDGQPIKVFNHGDMQRDFTYVDDVVEGTLRVLDDPAAPDPAFDASEPDPATSWAPWRVYNIGNHQPVGLLDYIAALERALGREAIRHLEPMQPGDVRSTFADTRRLDGAVGFSPSTPLEEGLARFAQWFRRYYGYG